MLHENKPCYGGGKGDYFMAVLLSILKEERQVVEEEGKKGRSPS